ncbi:metal-dependent transcriptional regulator [Saccharopolyspora sp. ID03-671]|uniref:metal-dependent transcriptional regulator n=1 Tax=Saccharopolyspora sp. ID03-671 TaxID=3073066 RepID=UPI00325100F5
MPDSPKGRSHAPEDYLRAIFDLAENGHKVTTTVLARELGVSPSSASAMVSKLRERGLVEHAPYGSISMTHLGMSSTLAVLRRRMLIELYLHRELGCRRERAHDDAAALEHAASETLISRIAQQLGEQLPPDITPAPAPSLSIVEPR